MTTKEQERLSHVTAREVVNAQLHAEQLRHDVVSAVVAVLEQHNGKKYSKRLLPALQEAAGEELYFSDEYGLQQLNTRSYYQSRGNNGWRLLLGHGTGCPIIDVDRIREHNACYLKAAAERNQARAALLATDWPEQLDAAATALKAAQLNYNQLMGGYIKTPDLFYLEKAHGFRNN
jgi:hypothetical protein